MSRAGGHMHSSRADGRQKQQHSINVSVRLRPPQTSNAAVCVTGQAVEVSGRGFSFASSVVAGSDQSIAYEALAAPLVSSLQRGYSCTLLAYGQTGSGKTHTMFGPPGSLTDAALEQAGHGAAPQSWGVFPRTVLELLHMPGFDGALHASAVEVYQDKAFDLLAERAPLTVGSSKAGHRVRAGAGKPIVIGNAGAESRGGAHPPGCRCGDCWKANKAALSARLAKRDGARTATKQAGPAAAAGGWQWSRIAEAACSSGTQSTAPASESS